MSSTLCQVVTVSLDELIGISYESFLDLLSNLTTNGPLLMDIHYRVAGMGLEPNTILIEVTGDDTEAKALENI